MGQTKLTFTVDQETVARLDRTAARLGMTKSGVVREAIREYAAHLGRLNEGERLKTLATLDEIMSRPPTRPEAQVEREIGEIRKARRGGGRRTRSDEP